jgi:hypothetical protein
MKTKTTLLAVFAAVLLGIGVTSITLINLDNAPEPQAQERQQQAVAGESDELISFTAEPGKNVLEQLTAHATVETKDSAYGVYVDSIDGKKGGDGGKYWTFYVDGKMAQVGAEAYVTNGGELIEWKFE